MTKRDIDNLRAQAEAEFAAATSEADARFKQQMGALSIVETMVSSTPTTVARSESITEQFGALSSLIQPMVHASKVQQSTVIEAVRDKILSSPERLWRVAFIEDALRDDGFIFVAKDPKSTINTSLARLVKQGIIKIAAHGKGRRPSTYKASDRMGQSENQNEDRGVKDAAA